MITGVVDRYGQLFGKGIKIIMKYPAGICERWSSDMVSVGIYDFLVRFTVYLHIVSPNSLHFR